MNETHSHTIFLLSSNWRGVPHLRLYPLRSLHIQLRKTFMVLYRMVAVPNSDNAPLTTRIFLFQFFMAVIISVCCCVSRCYLALCELPSSPSDIYNYMLTILNALLYVHFTSSEMHMFSIVCMRCNCAQRILEYARFRIYFLHWSSQNQTKNYQRNVHGIRNTLCTFICIAADTILTERAV